jgi:hypothetical protein
MRTHLIFLALLMLAFGCAPHPAAPAAPQPDPKPTHSAAPHVQPKPGTTRIAILDLGNPELDPGDESQPFLGVDLVPTSIKDVLPALAADAPDIVILHIHAPGGNLECAALAWTLHEAIAAKWRTIAWCRIAQSGSIVAVWPLDELWLHPEAKLGPATGLMYAHEAAFTHPSNREFDRRDKIITAVASLSRRSPLILHSMRKLDPLSAELDERGRAVRWSGDETLPVVLVRKGRILTLPASKAHELGVVDGLASTRDELARGLGLSNIEWTGQAANEQLQHITRQQVQARTQFYDLRQKYDDAVRAAHQEPDTAKRAAARKRARAVLTDLRHLLKKHPHSAWLWGITPHNAPSILKDLETQLR